MADEFSPHDIKIRRRVFGINLQWNDNLYINNHFTDNLYKRPNAGTKFLRWHWASCTFLKHDFRLM